MKNLFFMSFVFVSIANASPKDRPKFFRHDQSPRTNLPTRNQNRESSADGAGAAFLGVVFGGGLFANAKNTSTRQTQSKSQDKSKNQGAFFARKSSGGFSPGRAGFLNYIDNYEGSPYVWGAEGPRSFDCTGYVSYVLQQKNCLSDNVRLTSGNISKYLERASTCKPGDIISSPGHAAFYLSPGKVYGAVGGNLDEVTTHSYRGTCYKNPCFI